MIPGKRLKAALAVAATVAGLGTGLAACGPPRLGPLTADGRVRIVAAESQYGNVAAQVGGRWAHVVSIVNNPNTDPHSYEINAGVARQIDSAAIVVQNGLGYDSFMDTIESAAGRPGRRIIDVQKLLHLPSSTTNPHLWYDPATMPAVAARLASDLASIAPQHASYFSANAARFDASLQPWRQAIARLRTDYPGAPVASTEPVAGYLLQAAGLSDLTPSSFMLAIMNGVDPAPQDLTFQANLIRRHQVRALVYNQQVTGPVTVSFLAQARRQGIPLVGVYETMPAPGYDYQSWMLAETDALARALGSGRSTEKL